MTNEEDTKYPAWKWPDAYQPDADSNEWHRADNKGKDDWGLSISTRDLDAELNIMGNARTSGFTRPGSPVSEGEEAAPVAKTKPKAKKRAKPLSDDEVDAAVEATSEANDDDNEEEGTK